MDIDKLEAGPETDALVGKHVMGWTLTDTVNVTWDEVAEYRKRPTVSTSDNIGSRVWNNNRRVDEWCPSTDIVAAWEVVEKLEYNWTLGRDVGQCGDDYETSGDKLYRFVYSAPGMPMQGISANTAPLAICHAALKAIQNER